MTIHRLLERLHTRLHYRYVPNRNGNNVNIGTSACQNAVTKVAKANLVYRY